MTQEERANLIRFYEDHIASSEEAIEEMKNKVFGDVSKTYNEANIRYKEGFRDALKMVLDHMAETEPTEE